MDAQDVARGVAPSPELRADGADDIPPAVVKNKDVFRRGAVQPGRAKKPVDDARSCFDARVADRLRFRDALKRATAPDDRPAPIDRDLKARRVLKSRAEPFYLREKPRHDAEPVDAVGKTATSQTVSPLATAFENTPIKSLPEPLARTFDPDASQ